MASLDKKLQRWVDAGLIDADTHARIEAFEHTERKPLVAYALGVLGAGTVALGIVSVIAANWDAIPGTVKLGVDLLLGAALAAGVYTSLERGQRWVSEVLVTLYYGFTLASLALVGQVYQLGTPTYQALLLWSAVTLPFVLLGRSRYLGALVTAGLATTHAMSLEGLVDYLDLHGRNEDELIVAMLFVSPLLYVPLSRVPWLLRARPEYARTLGTLAWLAILCGGFFLQFRWYDGVRAGDVLSWSLAVTAAAAGGLAAALPRLYPELPGRVRRTLQLALGAGWLSLVLATSLVHGPMDFVGAILQVGWLALFAWAAFQLGWVRIFNTMTALIGLRVLVVYFEVFGSMLSTGLGLISGGMLTLGLAWLWRRKTREIAATLSTPRTGDGDVA